MADTTTQDIYTTIIAIVKKAIGISTFPVMVGDQNDSEIIGEYATIKIRMSSSVGAGCYQQKLIAEQTVDPVPPDVDPATIPEHFEIHESSIYEMSVSLQFHRGSAHEYARRVMNFAGTKSAQSILSEKNIAIKIPSAYRSLDYSNGAEWIPRSQMDLTLISSTEYAETVGVIETVDVTVALAVPNENEMEIKQ
jgi:hypothetical protein